MAYSDQEVLKKAQELGIPSESGQLGVYAQSYGIGSGQPVTVAPFVRIPLLRELVYRVQENKGINTGSNPEERARIEERQSEIVFYQAQGRPVPREFSSYEREANTPANLAQQQAMGLSEHEVLTALGNRQGTLAAEVQRENAIKSRNAQILEAERQAASEGFTSARYNIRENGEVDILFVNDVFNSSGGAAGEKPLEGFRGFSGASVLNVRSNGYPTKGGSLEYNFLSSNSNVLGELEKKGILSRSTVREKRFNEIDFARGEVPTPSQVLNEKLLSGEVPTERMLAEEDLFKQYGQQPSDLSISIESVTRQIERPIITTGEGLLNRARSYSGNTIVNSALVAGLFGYGVVQAGVKVYTSIPRIGIMYLEGEKSPLGFAGTTVNVGESLTKGVVFSVPEFVGSLASGNPISIGEKATNVYFSYETAKSAPAIAKSVFVKGTGALAYAYDLPFKINGAFDLTGGKPIYSDFVPKSVSVFERVRVSGDTIKVARYVSKRTGDNLRIDTEMVTTRNVQEDFSRILLDKSRAGAEIFSKQGFEKIYAPEPKGFVNGKPVYPKGSFSTTIEFKEQFGYARTYTPDLIFEPSPKFPKVISEGGIVSGVRYSLSATIGREALITRTGLIKQSPLPVGYTPNIIARGANALSGLAKGTFNLGVSPAFAKGLSETAVSLPKTAYKGIGVIAPPVTDTLINSKIRFAPIIAPPISDTRIKTRDRFAPIIPAPPIAIDDTKTRDRFVPIVMPPIPDVIEDTREKYAPIFKFKSAVSTGTREDIVPITITEPPALPPRFRRFKTPEIEPPKPPTFPPESGNKTGDMLGLGLPRRVKKGKRSYRFAPDLTGFLTGSRKGSMRNKVFTGLEIRPFKFKKGGFRL